MKQGIHPNWNPQARVVCACGTTFTTGSTIDSIRVEMCSACHPLYTGQQKLVDTLGQVDKFIKKAEFSKTRMEERKKIIEARQNRIVAKKKDKPSLKDLLMQARKATS